MALWQGHELGHGHVTMSRRRLVSLVFAASVFGIVLATIAAGGLARFDGTCRPCHAMRPYDRALDAGPHASTRCTDCHSSDGALALLADGVAMERRTVAAMLGRTAQPTATTVQDASCRNCHSSVLRTTVRGKDDIRVRHSDFSDVSCIRCHAGTAHRMSSRTYAAPRMEDCTGCHRVSFQNTRACDMCHPSDWYAESSQGATTWRVTHGPQWQQTHGMGDLSKCVSCHPPTYCIDCHDTVIPHPSWWPNAHGRNLTAESRESCEKCHEPVFCTNCHRIDMPHETGFLKLHDTIAKQTGQQLCLRCHQLASCEQCHIIAEHPDIDGVNRRHKR